MKQKHIEYHKDGSVWAKGDMVDGKCDGYWELAKQHKELKKIDPLE